MQRTRREVKKPQRFEDEVFLKGANNGYTKGRRIDPGFSAGVYPATPYDGRNEAYHKRVNEDPFNAVPDTDKEVHLTDDDDEFVVSDVEEDEPASESEDEASMSEYSSEEEEEDEIEFSEDED